VSTGHYTYSTF